MGVLDGAGSRVDPAWRIDVADSGTVRVLVGATVGGAGRSVSLIDAVREGCVVSVGSGAMVSFAGIGVRDGGTSVRVGGTGVRVGRVGVRVAGGSMLPAISGWRVGEGSSPEMRRLASPTMSARAISPTKPLPSSV
jgi:hypothetical protein